MTKCTGKEEGNNRGTETDTVRRTETDTVRGTETDTVRRTETETKRISTMGREEGNNRGRDRCSETEKVKETESQYIITIHILVKPKSACNFL